MNRATKWIIASAILAALAIGGIIAYLPHAREARLHEEAIAALPTRPTDIVYPEFIERIETAENQVRSGKNWREGLGALAAMYHANGYTQEAATLYGALVDSDPQNGRWTNRLASIYALYGQLDQAMLLWQRTARIAPDYLPAQLNLADAMIKTNRAAEAVPLYEAALKSDPQNPYAIAGLAQADIAAGNWEQAKTRLEDAGLASDVGIGENILVSVYERLGETENARAIRSRAKSTDSYIEIPDPWLDEVSEDCYDPFRLTLDAGAARRKGEQQRALRLLEKAIQVDSAYAHAHFQLGLLRIELRDLPAAKESLRRSVELDPRYGDGWATLIELSQSQREAERLLEEGLRKCPDSPTLHSLNGKRLKAMGRLDEALEAFKTVAALRPAEILGLIECSLIYFQQGKNELAVQTLQEALEIVPEDPMVLSTLAIHWINAGDESKAHDFALRCRDQPRLPKPHLMQVKRSYQDAFGQSPW
ncbi:tetratricopeptide repeat protein [Pelagicoccus sp. SDUM812003]|uniref:tetratricopeptide repeat protein n=1 Tax=Pelagicoccus sp. SDUM812003 TaxID=3041267 RepID=UPI00281059E8|nr:tetratricopeptide repeat protein [Pelagicoccus sp. SDUM812003]MDQ8201823.1 tetratricopeptide repeat protein [Pelagicoccus sp. SDUM812003]